MNTWFSCIRTRTSTDEKKTNKKKKKNQKQNMFLGMKQCLCAVYYEEANSIRTGFQYLFTNDICNLNFSNQIWRSVPLNLSVSLTLGFIIICLTHHWINEWINVSHVDSSINMLSNYSFHYNFNSFLWNWRSISNSFVIWTWLMMNKIWMESWMP